MLMPLLTFLLLNSACCLRCCDVICPSIDCSPWISLSTFSLGLWSCTEDPGSWNSDWCFKAVSFHLNCPSPATNFYCILCSPSVLLLVAFPVLIPKKRCGQIYKYIYREIMWYYLHWNPAQLEYLSDFCFPSQTPTEASVKSITGREKCFLYLSGEEEDTN